MIRTQFLLASLALLGAEVVFSAERIGVTPEASFIQSWDRDGDGKVAKAEYEAARKERFAATDEDSNGTLSADEYADEFAVRLDRQIADERKAFLEQAPVRFRALDKDHDKLVSRAEYDASDDGAIESLHPDRDARRIINLPGAPSRAAAFTRADGNADGKLDESEYLDELAGRLDRQIARVRRGQLKQTHVRFEAIDASHDGSISREEFFALSARQFQHADTNRDGAVSAEDPPAPRERARSRNP